MSASCLILSDTHLSREYGGATGRDLGRLLRSFPGVELILNGDIFDLSLDAPRTPLLDSTQTTLAAHPEFRQALAEHVRAGGKVTLVPGNHDAALTSPAGVESLRRSIGAPDARQVEVSPWFVRRGGAHVEHGHLYDPDNSFAHPLADHDPRTEPLGTALMRRFVAPNDALIFAHAHRTTPLSGLRTAFEKWGVGAPLVIVRYFVTAFGLVGDAAFGKPKRTQERVQGDARLVLRAEELEIPPDVLRDVLRIAREPTHESLRRTFFRLYFDRVLSACSLATGLGLLAAAGLTGASMGTGALLTALGGGYLMQSVPREKNRYGGRIVEEIGAAARLVRETTSADLVVFGHTHVPTQEAGYVNLGSFGYGRPTRPYLLLGPDGKPQVQHLPRGE